MVKGRGFKDKNKNSPIDVFSNNLEVEPEKSFKKISKKIIKKPKEKKSKIGFIVIGIIVVLVAFVLYNVMSKSNDNALTQTNDSNSNLSLSNISDSGNGDMASSEITNDSIVLDGTNVSVYVATEVIGTSILVKNGLSKEIRVDINYRAYSESLGIDKTENKFLTLKANGEESFIALDDNRCTDNSCSVSIIYYEYR
ncbi:MAG: hypothetical protein AABX66_04425 [Nanoarchaeota archaeon]